MTNIRDLDYEHDGLVLNGVLASPDEGAAPRPGIVLFHEAWGLGDHAVERAGLLAAQGYVVLAADLFGGRAQPADIGEAMAYLGALAADPTLMRARAGAAVAALKALPGVDPGRIAATGFCFGGTAALELARDGGDLCAVVSFHGGLESARPAVAGAVKARILVCTGGDDPLIPMAQVDNFIAEMAAAGADCQTIIYSRVQHSFTNVSARSAERGLPGLAYDEAADRRSWRAALAHFDEAFAEA